VVRDHNRSPVAQDGVDFPSYSLLVARNSRIDVHQLLEACDDEKHKGENEDGRYPGRGKQTSSTLSPRSA
jgi:hypothetical protein